MKITTNLLTLNPYSRPGTKLSRVTKIAIHYVGNAGSSAAGNRNYFENLKSTKAAYASSHYIVGLNGEIIQCVPENEIAYCTNAANSYSISIENCHPSSDGKFNDKTMQSLIELCADLCKRYALNPLVDLIRHYDVTGKACPLYYVRNPAAWTEFKQAVNGYINRKEEKEYKGEEKLTQLQFEIMYGVMAAKMKYNTVAQLPEYAEETIQKLINKGYLKGDDTGLSLSEDMIRLLVINDRAGVYDNNCAYKEG